jgi:uncharacterized protein
MVDHRSRTIDADVHVAVPSVRALDPYLSEYWRDETVAIGLASPAGIEFTYPSWSQTLATSGSELTIDRLREDVLQGVDLAVLQCYYALESFTHPYLGAAIARAVNSWLVERWLDQDDRLLASAVVTPQHTAEAIEEVKHIAADRRFVQLLLPARAIEPYGNKRFWPIWDAAADAGLALGLTIGGVSGTPPTAVNWLDNFFEDYVAGMIHFQMHLSSMLWSGLFDRLPTLRIVINESGWTWLPGMMWRFDREYKESRREVPWMKELPSDYLRRHISLTTAPTDTPPTVTELNQVLSEIDSDELLMYSSDYPHRYKEPEFDVFDAIEPEQADRIRWQNAWTCYDIGSRLPATSPLLQAAGTTQ